MIVHEAHQGSYPIETGRSETAKRLWGGRSNYSDTLLVVYGVASRVRELLFTNERVFRIAWELHIDSPLEVGDIVGTNWANT